MPKLLPLSDKREWYSPKDVEAVYGISRTTLFRMMKDAEEKGRPIRTAVLEFRNGVQNSRKRPFILLGSNNFSPLRILFVQILLKEWIFSIHQQYFLKVFDDILHWLFCCKTTNSFLYTCVFFVQTVFGDMYNKFQRLAYKENETIHNRTSLKPCCFP